MKHNRLDLTNAELSILENALAIYRTNAASNPNVDTETFNDIMNLDGKLFKLRKYILAAQLKR